MSSRVSPFLRCSTGASFPPPPAEPVQVHPPPSPPWSMTLSLSFLMASHTLSPVPCLAVLWPTHPCSCSLPGCMPLLCWLECTGLSWHGCDEWTCSASRLRQRPL